MILLKIVVLSLLLSILYQDLRYRAVYWISFPVLAGFLLLLKFQFTSFETSLLDATYILIFVGSQLFVLSAYFSLKNGRLLNITKGHLGLGDILFLVAISFYFSPVNYFLFYIFSLMLVLSGALILKSKTLSLNEIPLAGLQAGLLVLLLLSEFFVPGLKLYQDSWIYSTTFFK